MISYILARARARARARAGGCAYTANLAKFAEIWPNFGVNLAKFAEIWPNLA